MKAASITAVSIPERMAHLERDSRGYPIPYVVLRDPELKPHFAVNDGTRVLRCATRELCTVCGGRLMRGKWFIGGPKSAFDDAGAYYDPPVHFECMEYSCRVCPYLASPNWGKPTAHVVADRLKKRFPGSATFGESQAIDLRPSVIVAAMASRTLIAGDALNAVYVPNKPMMRVRFWLHGREITFDEASAITPIPERARRIWSRAHA